MRGGRTSSSTCTIPARASPASIRYRFGHYYDGDFNGFELTSDYRITPNATASVGWTRQDIKLPYGNFVNNLVPIKGNYSFTTLINVSALLQYNGQTGLFSSNVRFAWLNRSGTGLFVVYNDRRDMLSSTAHRNARPFVRRQIHAADRLLNTGAQVHDVHIVRRAPSRGAAMLSRRTFLRGVSSGVVAAGAALLWRARLQLEAVAR